MPKWHGLWDSESQVFSFQGLNDSIGTVYAIAILGIHHSHCFPWLTTYSLFCLFLNETLFCIATRFLPEVVAGPGSDELGLEGLHGDE
jgi:hypothetical protein